MILLINLLGLVLIAAIVWWFWLYKPTNVVAAQEKPLQVTVENGVYQPARIQLTTQHVSTLAFLRKDASPCAEVVIFPALGLTVELPLHKSVIVNLPPLKPGVYEFHCQMKMYSGELRVK